MQDCYVGDIGDYGKYGLLREICKQGLSLAVNWYKVVPKTIGKQDDGKYVEYLSQPQAYREYDPALYDALYKIVKQEEDRRIKRVEQERLFKAAYFSEEIPKARTAWHEEALRQTAHANTVFLDPDNGLETAAMHKKGTATEKHVTWAELKAYYTRGQNVLLYQHRPQMTPKETCISGILSFQKTYLSADGVLALEFPKYTNRFYFFFFHEKDRSTIERICRSIAQKWSNNGFCREIDLE